MITENVCFRNKGGVPLAGIIYRNEPASDTGVVFCHGLFSTKNGYKITGLAADIVAAGCRVLAFDFMNCGGSGTDTADRSIIREIGDLESAVEFFLGSGVKKIHLMGSSMGALVSLLYAPSAPENIASVITLAAPVDINGLIHGGADIKDVNALPDDGTTEIEGVPLRNSFFKEAFSINIAESLAKIRVPVLAFYGANDSVVPLYHADILGKQLCTYLETVIIDDADHFLARDGDLALLRARITEWLDDHACR